MQKVLFLKQPPICKKFSVDDHFEPLFECNLDSPPALFFAEKTEGAECTSCWTPCIRGCMCYRMTHQPQVHRYHLLKFLLKKSIAKQKFIKRFFAEIKLGMGDEATG